MQYSFFFFYFPLTSYFPIAIHIPQDYRIILKKILYPCLNLQRNPGAVRDRYPELRPKPDRGRALGDEGPRDQSPPRPRHRLSQGLRNAAKGRLDLSLTSRFNNL